VIDIVRSRHIDRAEVMQNRKQNMNDIGCGR